MSRTLFRLALTIAFFLGSAELSAAQGPGTASTVLPFIGELRPNQLPEGVSFGSRDDGVDVWGKRAVVTAGIFAVGDDEGRAYVFDFSTPGNPVQIAELRPSDNHAGNEFGWSAAITDRYVFVGAYSADGNRGAVYMYDLSDPANITERKIVAFDAAPQGNFGYALAASGSRLIVGSPWFSAGATLPAAAYVLDFSDPNNIRQTKLLATPGSVGGNFGEQVDISGDYAIVGHISESTQFPFSGAAHLYDLSDPNHIRQQRLHATDPPNHMLFGKRVAIDGTRALVSVNSYPGPGNPPGAPDGAVWAIDFSDWDDVQQYEFGRQPVGAYSAPFGYGLELIGTTAIAGAFNEDGTRGAVYLFDVEDVMNPREIERIAAPLGSTIRFGYALGFDGRTMIAADRDNHVYLFHLIPEPSSILMVLLALGSLAVIRWRRRR